jgi:hypothetical protein
VILHRIDDTVVSGMRDARQRQNENDFSHIEAPMRRHGCRRGGHECPRHRFDSYASDSWPSLSPIDS